MVLKRWYLGCRQQQSENGIKEYVASGMLEISLFEALLEIDEEFPVRNQVCQSDKENHLGKCRNYTNQCLVLSCT